MTQTTQDYYIELLEKKAAAYERLFEHYNNHDCVALAEFIATDEYYAKRSEEE